MCVSRDECGLGMAAKQRMEEPALNRGKRRGFPQPTSDPGNEGFSSTGREL